MSSHVDQIKSRLSISDVVESYLKLTKAGVNFKAVCPFHNEKTPSFFVSPGRESFHCFGCERSGDIFTFVMEIEGVGFPEALRILALKAGVELDPVKDSYKDERLTASKILEESKKFYETELKKNPEVIEYLKSREMKGETAKLFGVGFAPDGWRNLLGLLRDKGYSDSEIEESGMLVHNEEKKSYYDRFRSRIMFPITSGAGQVIGFSGRIFGGEGSSEEARGGKYINTPQTILYDKSKALYGFDKAKEEIRKKDFCVIVEGQMDVIMSYQGGVRNVVAVSGTALTEEHLRAIGRLTNNLVFSFDKDEAGFEASKRGIALAFREGFSVKVVVISQGKDPADVVKEDEENWLTAVCNAEDFVVFYLDYLKEKEKDEKILIQKVRELILPYLAESGNSMDIAFYVGRIRDVLQMTEEAIWTDVKRLKDELKKPSSAYIREKKEKSPRAPESLTRQATLERRLLGLLLLEKNSEDEDLRSLVEAVIKKRNFGGTGIDENAIKQYIFEAELAYSGSGTLRMMEEVKHLDLEIEKEETRGELKAYERKIREAEREGDEEGIKKYLNISNDLIKKLNSLSHEEKK